MRTIFTESGCRAGINSTLLFPKGVRVEMMIIIKEMGDEYAGVSRTDCRKIVSFVKELRALMENAEESIQYLSLLPLFCSNFDYLGTIKQ